MLKIFGSIMWAFLGCTVSAKILLWWYYVGCLWQYYLHIKWQ